MKPRKNPLIEAARVLELARVFAKEKRYFPHTHYARKAYRDTCTILAREWRRLVESLSLEIELISDQFLFVEACRAMERKYGRFEVEKTTIIAPSAEYDPNIPPDFNEPAHDTGKFRMS